ncbi:acyl-CoA dehydrogenase family protein, partial [Brevundimonas sp.]|uniref:acyl-CoA dehydrogenase family protein n=1 Tax=Brevundimonas sp. TaxID=1871086 RepID=UPI002FCBFE6B
MEFAFNEEQRMIAETAIAFFTENATSERTRAAMAKDGIDHDLWATFCQELGLSGIGIPEDVGGAGLGLVEMAIIAEAAGAQVAALPMLGSLVMCARAIAYGGTEQQKAELLPSLLSGERIAAYVHDAALTASDDVLTATDGFVAHGASADVFVVTSNSGAWIVDAPKNGTKSDGVTVTAKTTMDQTRPYASVVLNGAKGQPLADAATAIACAHRAAFVAIAAEALGGAQACLDRTVSYSIERVQFGRPIGSFQDYKHRLADIMI